MMKSEITIQSIDELIENTKNTLTELYKQRHAIHTKIMVSIFKDIYQKYQYKKYKDNSTLHYHPFFKYTTTICDEDIDRFIKELNINPQYPREVSIETFDKDSNIGISLINSFMTIYDYNMEKSPFDFKINLT